MQACKTILIFADWYIPGSKAGGPIQSIYNLANLLSNNYKVNVVCRDRDLNGTSSFPKIKVNEWNQISENHQVLYLSPDKINFKTIKQIIKENKFNILYVNGLYSFYFSILPVFLAGIFQVKSIFISVRGMLHQSAISVKRNKKLVFLSLAKGYGLYKNACMLSSNSIESTEIRNTLGNVRIESVPNIPLNPIDLKYKNSGKNSVLKILFLGRIAPEKNPITLLKALQKVSYQVSVTFCGSSSKNDYFNQFLVETAKLGSNIQYELISEFTHQEIQVILPQYDVMVMPSLGENFGHAIFESLAFGVPVIIGNNTPWKGLENNQAGFEIEPNNEEELKLRIDYFNNLSDEIYTKWSQSARLQALDYFNSMDFENKYLSLFQ